MKTKTNISTKNNLGMRIKSNMLVGETDNGFSSGDILDANAVVDTVKSGTSDIADYISEKELAIAAALNDLKKSIDEK